MTNFQIGITLFFSLTCVYYIIQPFLNFNDKEGLNAYPNDNHPDNSDIGDSIANKRRAQLLIAELEELKELYARGALSEAEFAEHRELLLKDAQEVI